MLDTRRAFENKWWNIREDTVVLPDGSQAKHYVRERAGASMVFALTKKNNVVLVDQYRHAQKTRFLELPAGLIEEGETPLETAVRELEEETGFTSDVVSNVLAIPMSQGYDTGLLHVFLAKNCVKEKDLRHEPTEDIKVVEMPLSEYKEMLLAGRLKHGISDAVAGYACLARLGELR